MLLLQRLLLVLLSTGKRAAWERLDASKVRLVSRVSYDGSSFSGFQFQPKGRTVQGVLEEALERRTGGQRTRLVGAGRTDAGVHAVGQAAHFDLPEELVRGVALRDLEHSINQLLPDDVRLWNVSYAPPPSTVVVPHLPEPVELPFHAIHSSTRKRYVYRFTNAKVPSPLGRRHRAHYYQRMDMDLMERALAAFEGRHNFASFANRAQRNAGEAPRSTVREVYSARLVREGGDDYRVDIELSGALYKMVRNLVGTAAAVASAELDLEDLAAIFAMEDRSRNPAKSAPACGLTLARVHYDAFGAPGGPDGEWVALSAVDSAIAPRA